MRGRKLAELDTGNLGGLGSVLDEHLIVVLDVFNGRVHRDSRQGARLRFGDRSLNQADVLLHETLPAIDDE